MKISNLIYITGFLTAEFLLSDCSFPALESILNEIDMIPGFVGQYEWWKPKQDPEVGITTLGIIRAEGYQGEAHEILTDDGYLLTMHRIPGPPGSQVVYLQHGLLASSALWLITGKNRALAFLLADQGYDVWMGNARGNEYSLGSINYTSSNPKFWDFSWNKMGTYDLPAEISYVTNLTKEKIIYIGHSMGTTMFFVMAIEKPEIAKNVKAMFALAPIAFMHNLMDPIRFFVPFSDNMQPILDLIEYGVFPPRLSDVRSFSSSVCNINYATRKLCSLFFGFDSTQFNYALLPRILNVYPSSTSVKALEHFAQAILSGRFQQYDYGILGNLKRYHNITPPLYDLSKIQVPVGLFSGPDDWLADPTDVEKLSEALPNLILNYRVNYSKFNHLDFYFAIDVYKLVYKDLLTEVNKYR